jgi:hypothetical protein
MTVNTHASAAPSVEIGLGATLVYNGLTMHDRESGPDCYLVQRIDGLGVPDIRDARDVNPSDHGETAFSSFFGGRNIVLDGIIIAGNMAKLRSMINDLKGAFGFLETNPLTFVGESGYGFEDAYIDCRLTGLSIPETQENMYPRRPFQVTLRAADPFIKAVDDSSTTKLYSSVTSLGRAYNRVYTLAYTSSIDSSGSIIAANSFVVENRGNYLANPTFRIVGPVTDPVVVNYTNGASFAIDGTIAEGDYFDIDMNAHTMVDSLGNNKFSLLEQGSDWITLEPGSNTFTIASTSFSGSAAVTISFTSTWL